jgi:hypothetical protein
MILSRLVSSDQNAETQNKLAGVKGSINLMKRSWAIFT